MDRTAGMAWTVPDGSTLVRCRVSFGISNLVGMGCESSWSCKVILAAWLPIVCNDSAVWTCRVAQIESEEAPRGIRVIAGQFRDRPHQDDVGHLDGDERRAGSPSIGALENGRTFVIKVIIWGIKFLYISDSISFFY